MHKSTLISLLLACFALLSLVAAQCGPGAGSCPEGNCCSRDGFCGNSELHCGPGCQVGFGACAGSGSSSTVVDPSATTAPYTPSASTSSEAVLPTVSSSSIMTSVVAITTTTTATPSSTPSSSPSTKGTFQLQPTGRPSGATPSQDNGVRSTVALVVVFIAGMMMV
ncbi:hypothetical protein EC968_001446 [Mortierella alpina]|nr:hypothetical protein EC968_001446 [Mortierella alpina]